MPIRLFFGLSKQRLTENTRRDRVRSGNEAHAPPFGLVRTDEGLRVGREGQVRMHFRPERCRSLTHTQTDRLMERGLLYVMQLLAVCPIRPC